MRHFVMLWVVVGLLIIPIARATAAPIGLGAQAKVGVLIPTNRLATTVMLGLEVRERLPFFGRLLGLAVDFGYFQPRLAGSGSDPAVGGAYQYSVATRALALGVDALVFLPLKLPVDLYAGVGYGAFFYAVSAKAFDTTTLEYQTRHGVRARVGVLWPFWRMLYVSGEVVYNWADFQFLITGGSNAGAVSAGASLGFEL